MYKRPCIHVCIPTQTYIRMCVFTRVCMYMYVYMCTRSDVYTYAYTYLSYKERSAQLLRIRRSAPYSSVLAVVLFVSDGGQLDCKRRRARLPSPSWGNDRAHSLSCLGTAVGKRACPLLQISKLRLWYACADAPCVLPDFACLLPGLRPPPHSRAPRAPAATHHRQHYPAAAAASTTANAGFLDTRLSAGTGRSLPPAQSLLLLLR
jgi:hypothetical protein